MASRVGVRLCARRRAAPAALRCRAGRFAGSVRNGQTICSRRSTTAVGCELPLPLILVALQLGHAAALGVSSCENAMQPRARLMAVRHACTDWAHHGVARGLHPKRSQLDAPATGGCWSTRG